MRRSTRGEPRGGTGGGTFDLIMPVFCFNGGNDGECILCCGTDDGAVVTIGLASDDCVEEEATVTGVSIALMCLCVCESLVFIFKHNSISNKHIFQDTHG